MRLRLAIVALVLLGASRGAVADEPAAARLSRGVQKVVPRGWSVRLDGATVVASREVVVVVEGDVAYEGEEPPERRDYRIVLVVGERLAQSELDALRARNRRVEQNLARLERKMRRFACDALDQAYRDHCYRPRSAGERALIERHTQLRAQLRVLPAHHTEDGLAVTVSVSEEPWYESMSCDDCGRVRAAIEGLLVPYSP